MIEEVDQEGQEEFSTLFHALFKKFDEKEFNDRDKISFFTSGLATIINHLGIKPEFVFDHILETLKEYKKRRKNETRS